MGRKARARRAGHDQAVELHWATVGMSCKAAAGLVQCKIGYTGDVGQSRRGPVGRRATRRQSPARRCRVSMKPTRSRKEEDVELWDGGLCCADWQYEVYMDRWSRQAAMNTWRVRSCRRIAQAGCERTAEFRPSRRSRARVVRMRKAILNTTLTSTGCIMGSTRASGI